jgi:two-component system chemotaxis sensor kinase CheA
VVRSNIEKIGGSTDLSSRLGKGTTLRIKIPLTLAIVPALLVSTGAERFAIPQVNLVELVRVDGENIKRHIESIHGARFYRLRGNLLPLVYLSEELKIADGESGDRDKINIVVVKADERSFGIVVDVIHDTEEIVVKPLGKQLKQLSVFAGATIMGDGRIALILDVLGIARKARVLSESTRRAMEKSQVASESVEQRVRESLLIVQSGKCARAAVPLSAVQRLEEFPLSAIEQAGGVEVVQYRGGILPLIDLSLLLTGEPSVNDDSAALRQVVVYARGTTVCGFVVSRIVDIVEDSVKLQLGSSRPGIKGSAIIQKQVTEMLDLDSFVGAMPLLVSESVTQEANV